MAQPAPYSNPFMGLQSPEQIQQNRLLGQKLMQQGMSTEPVGHWTQGLARVLQAGVGRMNVNQADDAAQARQGATMSALDSSGALSGLSPADRSLIGADPEMMKAALSKVYANKLDPHTGLRGDQIKAATEQARAHARYYDTMGGVARQRADISGDRAQTERTRLIADTLARFGADPTPDVWARENQPGGFIHARFGGPVPYEQRGPILTQLRERSNMPSDEVEMLDLGFTSDDIRSMKRQRVLDAFKVPKDTAGERQGAIIAQQGLRNLDDAEKLLKDASWWEQLAGDRWTVPGTKDVKVGGFGAAGRGFKAAEMAILDLNFALSGKSVSNAERDKFNELYMPRSTESREMQAFKLNKVREFFGVVLEARKKGLRDEQIGELYRDAIQQGMRGPQQPAPRNGIDRDALTREAEDAIARGAPRDKVMQRLQQQLQGGR